MSVGQSVDPILPNETLAAAPDVRRKTAITVAYVILGALTLSPLLWAAVPPLVDYPNHLARMWILLHAKDIPALAQNYLVAWRLLPDLAMDLTVPALAQVLPLEVAGRVFIAVTMANLVLATVALHRVLHGRVGLWPLCSLLFVYNAALFWGFLNFLFTLGLALLAFSAWLASARWRPRTRIMVFSLPAALLLVFHLFAFGVYGLLVASHQLGRSLSERQRPAASIASGVVVLAQFIPAATLFLLSLRTVEPSYTAFGTVGDKLYAARAPWDFGAGWVSLDMIMMLSTLAFLIYAALTRALRLSPAMRVPILTLLVAAAAMPHWIIGSAWADLRLPIALSFVIIASTRPEPARRAFAVCAAAALGLLALRIWAVSENWREADRQFAEFRAVSRSLPEGARLLIVEDLPNGDGRPLDAIPPALARRELMTYWHMAALATIDRSVFIPYLFTGYTPIRLNPRNAAMSESMGIPVTPARLVAGATPGGWSKVARPNELGQLPHWRNWPETFDFVLWINAPAGSPVLADRLQPWASGSFFRIYRIIRP